MHHIVRLSLLAALLISVLAACSAREEPPQLAYTPGAPFTLTDSQLMTGLYTVTTPTGWRVISGPAEDPYTFQFVRPDNRALIVLSTAPVAEPPIPLALEAAAAQVARFERELAPSLMLYVVAVANASSLPATQALAESVLESAQ